MPPFGRFSPAPGSARLAPSTPRLGAIHGPHAAGSPPSFAGSGVPPGPGARRRPRARCRHAGSDRRDDRGQPAVGAGLPRRLAAGLRGDAPRARRGRRGLAGDVHGPRRELGVQGAAERLLGRELRSERAAERAERPARPRHRRRGEVLLRPRDALDHGQRQLRHRGGAGQLPVRAGLPRRLGSGLPQVVAPGSGRRRDLRLHDQRAPRGRLRGEGRHRRELVGELRRGRRPERPEHPLHRGGRLCRHRLPLRRPDARPHGGRRRRAAAAGQRDDRREPPVRARLCGRLGSRLRRGAPRLRRERRRLAGNVPVARRQLRVQGGVERFLGRELRRGRGAERSEHRSRPRRAGVGEVLLRPRHALDHLEPQRRHRHGAGQLPVRAWLPRRLGSWLPPVVAPRSGRRRDLPLHDDGAPARQLRGEGRDRRELGPELRRGRRPERRERRVHRALGLRRDDVRLELHHARSHRRRHGRAEGEPEPGTGALGDRRHHRLGASRPRIRLDPDPPPRSVGRARARAGRRQRRRGHPARVGPCRPPCFRDGEVPAPRLALRLPDPVRSPGGGEGGAEGAARRLGARRRRRPRRRDLPPDPGRPRRPLRVRRAARRRVRARRRRRRSTR